MTSILGNCRAAGLVHGVMALHMAYASAMTHAPVLAPVKSWRYGIANCDPLQSTYPRVRNQRRLKRRIAKQSKKINRA